MKLRLSKIKFLGLIVFSIFLGYIAQQIYISDASKTPTGYNQIGFAILIPVFVALFIGFLHLVKLKNKFLITILSMGLFLFIFGLNFALYPVMGGSTSEMYGLMFVLGFLPSLLVGLFYGLYIAYNIDKQESKLQKFIIYFGIILVIFFFAFLIIKFFTCSFSADYICLSHKAVKSNDINICYKAKLDDRIDSCLFYTYTNKGFLDKSCEQIKSEWKFNNCIKSIETPAFAPVKNKEDCLNYLDLVR